MDDTKREIREALLGNLISVNRRLVVSEQKLARYRFGISDGFESAFFLGVMRTIRWYRMQETDERIMEIAVKAMMDMGRMIDLGSRPEAEAVYCSYLLNNPAILTVSVKDHIIEVSAYAGRGISGMIAVYRTLQRFQKRTSKEFERLDEKETLLKNEEERERIRQLEQERKEEQQRQKAEKKEKKLEEKRARQKQGLRFWPFGEKKSDRTRQRTSRAGADANAPSKYGTTLKSRPAVGGKGSSGRKKRKKRK